jgi:hypothetical protein
VGRRIAASSALRSAWQPFPASAASACKTRCISRRRIDIGKRKITDAPGVASPALAFLLNAAIWRHHIDGGSRNSSDPRCGKFNRAVVNVKIKNCFVLISVYFIVAVVHGVKLPQFKCKRQFNPRKIFRLIMGSACRWRANLRRYRTLGFQIKFETPRVIGAAAENFGEGAQLHCGIFPIAIVPSALLLRDAATKDELCGFRRRL